MRKIILALLLFGIIGMTNATTYCVNQTGGNDSNNGDCATPWATIRKAMVTIATNDTVVIDSGNYEEVVIASNSLQTADDNVSYIGFGMPVIRLANVTCNRVVDVVNNNVSFDGIVFDLNGTLDTCEFGVFIRNNKNYLTVKNSIIKNGVGASAAAITLESSGQTASNNALIYNNSFINNENYQINLVGGFQNNTNISKNYIEVGKTTLDYGIIGSSSTGADAFNFTLEYNNFNWTGTVGQEGYGLVLQRTTTTNSSYGINIRFNTFGEPTNKWEGTPIRIVRQKESNLDQNVFWVNDTTGNNIIWYEGNNSNITITNNQFCSPANLCSAVTNPFAIGDASNVIAHNNTIYYDKFGGDGLWIQSATAAQSNATITNNYIFIANNSLTGHIIGSGSEGTGSLYSNVFSANNIVNITCSTANASSHNHFLGTTSNATVTNNTIICGTYGLLAKLSTNITYENNFVYNVSLATQYDKGSNNTIFRHNYLSVLNTTSQVNLADGINAASLTQNATFYNNTIVYPNANQNSTTIALSLGLYQTGTQSYGNIYYLPYRSYNRTFVNYTTYYNYPNWLTTFNLDLNSTFYPNDTTTLTIANNTFYNGSNWTSQPQINGITIANATLYINYTNGTNYATVQNTSQITNATNNTLYAQINTTNNFTWNVCYIDPNSFATCATEWFTIQSDATNPVLTTNLPANNTNQSSTTLTINFSATDETSLSTCWYSINNTANFTVAGCVNATSNQTTATVTTGDNQNITIYANDSLGNTISAIRTFNIDTTAPTITVNSPTNNTNISTSNLTINFSATDAHDISTCWYSINNTANVTVAGCINATTNQTNASVTMGANQNITIYVNDSLGNLASVIKTFNREIAAPVITINLPANNTNQTSTTLTLNFSTYTQGTIDTCKYSINNTANVTVTGCVNATSNQTNINVTNGINQNITLYINDTDGHLSSSTQYFTIDNTAPALTINNPTNNTSQSSTTLTINFSATDATALSTCWYSINNTANVTVAGCVNATSNQTTATVTTGDNQNITIYANDSLGNQNSTTHYYTITQTTTTTPTTEHSTGSTTVHTNQIQNTTLINPVNNQTIKINPTTSTPQETKQEKPEQNKTITENPTKTNNPTPELKIDSTVVIIIIALGILSVIIIRIILR